MQTVDITPPKKMPFDTENMALDSFLVDTKVTTVTGSDNPGLYHHGKPPLAVTTSGTSRIQSQLVLNQVRQQVEEKVGPLLALSEEYRTHFPHYVLEALDTAADGDGAVGFLCSMESNRNLLLHRIHTNTNKANGVAEASPLLRSPVAAGPPDKSLLQPCESTSLFPSMFASTSARRAKDYAFFNGMLEPHDVLLLHTCGRDAMGGEVLLRAAMEGVDLHQRVMHYLNSFVPVEKGSEKEE
ncbi:hypothetical protein, conserved [Angomonas deanei]|uniref:Uncharacterized protein n=1 Tax=Angomonas deanei TaxID=59799 RepID=A0A7G2CMC5_9TRYP|nr:hypothetical protein, conserved [Angomonas deanei]